MKKNALLLLICAVSIVSIFATSQTPAKASYDNGKTVYNTYCITCHMEDGNGVEGVYPTLVKTGNLTDKNRMVKIILQGMRGKITVKGVNYETEMAPIALSDKETADVINYIRNSWGNKAPYLKTTDIAPAKKALIKNYQPF